MDAQCGSGAVDAGGAALALIHAAGGGGGGGGWQDGWTPLHWASYKAHLAVVEALIGKGAKIKTTNEVGAALSLRARGEAARLQQRLDDGTGDKGACGRSKQGRWVGGGREREGLGAGGARAGVWCEGRMVRAAHARVARAARRRRLSTPAPASRLRRPPPACSRLHPALRLVAR